MTQRTSSAFRRARANTLAVACLLASVLAVANPTPADAANTIAGLYPVRDIVTNAAYADLERDPTSGYMWATNPVGDRVDAYDASGTVVATIGVSGSGPAQLDHPTGLAVRSVPSGSELYVADTNNARVQVYATSGAHLRSIGVPGSGAGALEEPCAIEVVGNRVYVADATRNSIHVFSLGGQFVAELGGPGSGTSQLDIQCSAALAHADGELYIGDGRDRIVVLGIDGTFKRNIASNLVFFPTDVEVDGAGTVWVTTVGDHMLSRWSATGDSLGSLGGFGTMPGEFQLPVGLEVDPTGETVWVTETQGNRVQEFTTALCNGQVVTHAGSSFVDTYATGFNRQVIAAGAGDDIIEAGPGNDLVCGDTGDDNIRLGLGDDEAFGGLGDDRILGMADDDLIFGQGGNDVIDGGSGDDRLFGQGGDDRIRGADGADVLRGGADDDVINSGAADDRAFGNAGDDVINGGDGRDILRGQANVDELNGNAGNDRLIGGGGPDVHNGGAGQDVCLEGAAQGLTEVFISCERKP